MSDAHKVRMQVLIDVSGKGFPVAGDLMEMESLAWWEVILLG